MADTRKKPATIYDIARQTKLSAATVSRVLNGKSNIADDTRERVLEAASAMDYFPNHAARSLKLRSTKQVLLSIPHLHSAFYADLIEAIQRTAISKGYSLILHHTHASETEELNLLQNIKENYVDGMILISINITEKHIREIDKLNAPVVLSGICLNHLDGKYRSSYDYVGVDTLHGMFLSTEHLIRQGHRRIGYVGLPLHTQTGDERFRGYVKAMEKWKLPVNPQWTLFGGYTTDFGYSAGKTLCALGERPTALVATCDHICLGLYMVFDEMGVSIPGDMALVGMDNIEVSAIVKPKLSTVTIASSEIGDMAGKLLFQRLAGWEGKKQNVVFKPMLIVRESSVTGGRQPAHG